ncbi:hypothetical protein Tsubulata_048992 [Turnera subulata]|uniref:SMP domain-containing protein n=1 Tax=Turnera subulata TaxID=218843 RepID=A0A9Q0JP16_9ROSI|nr:hypothetical protein Tsubulata_016151 [Turnera subulata]KAJ4849916.1 hypothetical protein Tsubulata_048992 [Turnera subulata]
MSQQQQPQRPQHQSYQDPIKYGDVFDVQGDLASKPITPQDAGAMQAAEHQALGETPKGGPASAMQSAAKMNVGGGLLDPSSCGSKVQGISVSERNEGQDRIITEKVSGQVVAEFVEPRLPMTMPGKALDPDAITIGEALEATAVSPAGNKPVDQGDAAAIQAAEARVTGLKEVLPGGLGAQAQSAANRNPRATRDEDKTTIGDVVADATMKLPADRAVTREDAEVVIEAEVRNKPGLRATAGGVARSIAAAARINQNPGEEDI